MEAKGLRIENLSVMVERRPILTNISCAAAPGELLFILGNNGAGKSTLLKSILGTVPYSGSITVNGNSRNDISRKSFAAQVGYIPQAVTSNIPFTVRQFVALAGFARNQSEGAMAPIVQHALEVTGCEAISEQSMATLSGGERQRTLFAGAIAQQPQIILIDEPTTYLDPAHQALLAQLFKTITHNERITVIAVTHDLNFALSQQGSFIALREGTLAASGSLSALASEENLARIYNQPFIVHHAADRSLVWPKLCA